MTLLSFRPIAILALASTLLLGQPPEATAAGGLEHLQRATKAFEDEKYLEAQSEVDEAIKAAADKETTARAMLLRAQIHEKSGKLARSLSDYSGALWMQTLPSSEAKKATAGKERVMAAMGLNGGGEAAGSKSAVAPTGSSPASAAAAPASSGGLFGMFGGLFGGGSEPPKAAAASPPPQTATPSTAAAEAPKLVAKEKRAVAVASADDAETKTKLAVRKPKEKPEAAKAKPVPTGKVEKASAVIETQASDGGIFIDFGSAASVDAAKKQATVIKTKLSDILINRELLVKPGAGGFRIVAGPYKAKASASAVCSAMSQRSVTCKVTGG